MGRFYRIVFCFSLILLKSIQLSTKKRNYCDIMSNASSLVFIFKKIHNNVCSAQIVRIFLSTPAQLAAKRRKVEKENETLA
jgi:hypothetical protein